MTRAIGKPCKNSSKMEWVAIIKKIMKRGAALRPIALVLFTAMGMVLPAVCWGDGAGATRQNPYSGFPLYKDVSGTRPFATLDEGQLPNETRWGAYASRVGGGRRGFEQPCLSLGRITRSGEYTDVHGCGPLVPTKNKSAPNYIYIAGSYQNKVDGPFIGETVLALSFAPTVRSVVLKYVNGGQLRRRTRLFNRKQQKKTMLAPFRYIALAMQADECAGTVSGYAKDGTEIFSEETVLCSDF